MIHLSFSLGFGTGVSAAPVSPTKKQLSPDHPNPALPITEVITNQYFIYNNMKSFIDH